MRIILGKDPNAKFIILDDEGNDLTSKIPATRITIDASHDDLTTATLVVEVEVDVEVEDGRVKVSPKLLGAAT